MNNRNRYINSKRVAAFLGISVNTLHGMLQNNELPEYGKAIKRPGNSQYTYIYYTDKLMSLFDEEKFPL